MSGRFGLRRPVRTGYEVVHEGLRGVSRRWQRFLLSVVAVAVGTASLVATIALTQTNATEIASTLASYSDNSLVVRLPASQWERSESDIVDRASQVQGVVGAGTFTEVDSLATPVNARSVRSRTIEQVPIVIASAQGLNARGAVVREGALASSLAARLDQRLLAVGSSLARDLRVSTEEGLNLVELNGKSYVVSAIIDESGPRSLLTTAIVIAPSAVSELHVDDVQRRVLVSVNRGDRNYVARFIPTAINSERPSDATVESRPDPSTLTGRITADTAGLILVLSAVTVIAGAVGVANTMLIAVWERRSEIGLRRALGASRAHIGALFLIESVAVGGIGSVIGWLGGVLIATGTSEARGWQIVMPAWMALLPLSGVVVGMAAGVNPAWRAARVDPAALLRE